MPIWLKNPKNPPSFEQYSKQEWVGTFFCSNWGEDDSTCFRDAKFRDIVRDVPHVNKTSEWMRNTRTLSRLCVLILSVTKRHEMMESRLDILFSRCGGNPVVFEVMYRARLYSKKYGRCVCVRVCVCVCVCVYVCVWMSTQSKSFRLYCNRNCVCITRPCYLRKYSHDCK